MSQIRRGTRVSDSVALDITLFGTDPPSPASQMPVTLQFECSSLEELLRGGDIRTAGK